MTSKDNQPNNSQPLQSTSPINPNPQTDSSELIPAYSLQAFIGLAGKVFRESLPSLVWIDAVVFDIKAKGKGFAVELLDPSSKDTSQGASLHAFIWRRGQDAIGSAIGCAFTPALLAGVEARLLIEPSFHPRFHVQSNIIGIDPELSERHQTIQSWSSLVRPSPHCHWDEQAAAVHKIARADLQDAPEPCFVAAGRTRS